VDGTDSTEDELGGDDNRPNRKVTTNIDHLSGYSVASG
jgi:hypothetical protein